MDNLEEMEKFLEKFHLPKLSQEEIEIMNNPITRTEMEAEMKISQKAKAQDQMASHLNSSKNVENSLHRSYSNSSRKLQRKVDFQTHSMRPPSP